MLQIKMLPPSAVFTPYIWSYGATSGRVDTAPLLIPLPARPKQLVTFTFSDGYRLIKHGSATTESTPLIATVGLQSSFHAGLSAFGNIDNFTIHFQPSGFNQLFGVPMMELTDGAHDAHGVVGAQMSALYRELGEARSFNERITITEKFFKQRLSTMQKPDAVAMIANNLFANNGTFSVSSMATTSGLSIRQFERRFQTQVGLPPKLYSRITKFNAVLDNKLHFPKLSWGRLANDHDYYDQMHFVRDCRNFTGESPSRFLERLQGAPALIKHYATPGSMR
jgi:AraC-like DNA-binding protein